MVVFPAKRAAATLFGLWRYDDDIWLYGLCCDGKRKIECSIATVICILDVLQNWLVPFFFSFQFLYTTPLLWLSTLVLMLCCSIKNWWKIVPRFAPACLLVRTHKRMAHLSVSQSFLPFISIWPTAQWHTPGLSISRSTSDWPVGPCCHSNLAPPPLFPPPPPFSALRLRLRRRRREPSPPALAAARPARTGRPCRSGKPWSPPTKGGIARCLFSFAFSFLRFGAPLTGLVVVLLPLLLQVGGVSC